MTGRWSGCKGRRLDGYQIELVEKAGQASVLVRPAELHDGTSLIEIDIATWSPTVSPGDCPAPDQPFFDTHCTPHDVLIAEVGGTVVGYVRLGVDIPIPSAAHVMALRGLAVAPARQGHGIGRSLVQAAVDFATNKGIQKLKSRVLATNVASLALHQACGFEVEGVLKGEFLLDGEFVDDVLLAKPLNGQTN